MKVIKKLFVIVLACTLIGTGLFYKPILPTVTAADTDYTEQLENDKLSPIIYRTSVEGTNVSNTWNFIFSLVARENGNIHIDVQCVSYKSSWGTNINDIGNIAFNDSQIAAVGEVGTNGKSVFRGGKSSSYSKFITSYVENNVVYTCIYSNYGDNLPGQNVMWFDLYVKEPYLTTNQIINLFGTEVEIPFGNPPIDKDVYIKELENKVTELESNPITSYKPGDINGDGIIDATDASSILCYYAYVMTGGDGNLNILDFVENEDEYMSVNVTSTITTAPTTITTTTTQTTATTTTTPSMDIGGSKSNYESEFSSNNTGGIRNQFDKEPMTN